MTLGPSPLGSDSPLGPSPLAAIHGDDKDGSPKKRRRYARRGQKLLDISQSVAAAHGLKEEEAASAGEDVTSSKDE